jgi:glutamate-1-semialdehyde 2,1-aminomutase
MLDRGRLARVLQVEQGTYVARNPRSEKLYAGATNLFGRVPMTWMNMWSGGFPLYLDSARGGPSPCRPPTPTGGQSASPG